MSPALIHIDHLSVHVTSPDADAKTHRLLTELLTRMDTMGTNQDRINAAAEALVGLAGETQASVDALQANVAAEFASLRSAIAENGDAALADAADKLEAALAAVGALKGDVESTPVAESTGEIIVEGEGAEG